MDSVQDERVKERRDPADWPPSSRAAMPRFHPGINM
jgi:hypothetical protein